MKPGKFYGIGVGPGDPQLLTVKAVSILRNARVVCSPKARADKKSIALQTIKDLLRKNCEILQPVFPMTTDKSMLEKHWNAAAELVLERLRKGTDVAFVTIGDPLFYSTYTYVLERIQKAGIRVETVPGIPSPFSCMAELNLPLVEGKGRLAVIPAEYGIEGLEDTARSFDTVILMKVSRSFEKIVKTLEKARLIDDAIFVSKCGTENFFSSKLKLMKGKEADFMSMIIIRRKK